MTTNKTSAYRESGILTADPVTLTTMLFDGALKALKRARLFHENEDRRHYLDEVDRAYQILGELLAALDLEQGDIPRALSGIYAYCMGRLTEATLGDVTLLDEVERHISRIATSWKTATDELRAAGELPPAGTAAS